ncbi:EthD family reductase [Aneurinibacillus sp. Ricciae_BoGa-3]|uniref:EthD family reductase n=1 Tax=Aneurinibacillus sp. Ricciae_BoGa-3 TaxID=3022697 RepID=UPI0023412744|nr:EthD family reductase [Aneurinibacillus sp. Ricciae_BoGa-3]WCK56336.1 EthD family reductase [Aneurinibacillus sp. Ricciae_BoGa-3]
MTKITVLLPKPDDQAAFEEYYFGIHLPLVEKLPNVKDVSIMRSFEVHNFDIELYFVVQFGFENRELMNESLQSPEGQALYADVSNLMKFLPTPPMMIFADSSDLTS